MSDDFDTAYKKQYPKPFTQSRVEAYLEGLSDGRAEAPLVTSSKESLPGEASTTLDELKEYKKLQDQYAGLVDFSVDQDERRKVLGKKYEGVDIFQLLLDISDQTKALTLTTENESIKRPGTKTKADFANSPTFQKDLTEMQAAEWEELAMSRAEDIEELETQVAKYKKFWNDTVEFMRNLRAELHSRHSFEEHQGLDEMVWTLEKRIQELEKQIENFEVKNANPAKTLCPACGEEAVRLDVADLQLRISELEAELTLKDQMHYAAINTVEIEKAELENECNWLNGEVAKYVLEADEIQLQRDALNDENNELHLQIAELQEKLDWILNHKP